MPELWGETGLWQWRIKHPEWEEDSEDMTYDTRPAAEAAAFTRAFEIREGQL
jgi:hypothetical protein